MPTPPQPSTKTAHNGTPAAYHIDPAARDARPLAGPLGPPSLAHGSPGRPGGGGGGGHPSRSSAAYYCLRRRHGSSADRTTQRGYAGRARRSGTVRPSALEHVRRPREQRRPPRPNSAPHGTVSEAPLAQLALSVRPVNSQQPQQSVSTVGGRSGICSGSERRVCNGAECRPHAPDTPPINRL